jgi:hypothetical protein
VGFETSFLSRGTGGEDEGRETRNLRGVGEKYLLE